MKLIEDNTKKIEFIDTVITGMKKRLMEVQKIGKDNAAKLANVDRHHGARDNDDEEDGPKD